MHNSFCTKLHFSAVRLEITVMFAVGLKVKKMQTLPRNAKLKISPSPLPLQVLEET